MNLIPLLLLWAFTRGGGHAAAPSWPTPKSPPPSKAPAAAHTTPAAHTPATSAKHKATSAATSAKHKATSAAKKFLKKTGVPKIHFP